ncbi:hypothetical protein [Anaerococcus cruorum]|uniref:Sigma-70 family RNA polymerase sigma factor n=1 Tax=Anaerococcus cruorum TaxID=3115617 RepID=A0ABW9MW80_9FIRM
MNRYKYQRDKNKKWERLTTIKARLKNYKNDLIIADEIMQDIKILKDGIIDLSSGLGNTELIQGGGTSKEDRYYNAFDDIFELEKELKRINLDNRALINAMNELPDDEDRDIIKHLWILDDETMRSIGQKYNLSKSGVQRKSDRALLELHEKLYIRVPNDLDPK